MSTELCTECQQMTLMDAGPLGMNCVNRECPGNVRIRESMKNLRVFVPYKNSATPEGLAQTILKQQQRAKEKGKEVMVAICIVEKLDNGNNEYFVYNTQMPGEVALMIAHEVYRRLKP